MRNASDSESNFDVEEGDLLALEGAGIDVDMDASLGKPTSPCFHFLFLFFLNLVLLGEVLNFKCVVGIYICEHSFSFVGLIVVLILSFFFYLGGGGFVGFVILLRFLGSYF